MFQKKYENQTHLEVLTNPGDSGVEGFLEKVIFFNTIILMNIIGSKFFFKTKGYKVSKDLKKLKTDGTELAKKLGSALIKKRCFVVS